MPSPRIAIRTSGRTSVITLSRPEKRNALDDQMVEELTRAFHAAARDAQVRAVVLRAEGPAFCAGADLEYLQRMSGFDLEQNREDSRRLAHLFRMMHELRKPVIAAVQGPALAGGCGLATVCDVVLAARGAASFGYTEVRIGFIPAIVMVFLLRRVGEGRAREMVLGGSVIDAESAHAAGLVNALVAPEELDAAALELAGRLAQDNSAVAMGLCKELLARLPGMNLQEALDFAANMNAAARMTQDCREGIAAFLRKEKPAW